MLDLNKMVEDGMQNMIESGVVQEMVKNQLEKTIQSIVEDAFNSWSPFGKGLKEKVKEEMKVNLDRIDLREYNDFVLTCIHEVIGECIEKDAKKEITERLQSILGTSKEEYSITELLDIIRDEYGDSDDEMTLIINQERSFVHVYFDEQEDQEKYECKYSMHFMLDKENEDEYYPSVAPYRIAIGEKNYTTRDLVSGLHGLDEAFYHIYLNGSKIKFDEGFDSYDYDTNHGDREEREENY